MNKIEKIQPSGIFTTYVFKALPLAFDESLSYYEMLCALLDRLKTDEQVINNNADLLMELESYVKHYFDNLDVQEEINNKLDEMAESGQLADIIADYLELKGVLAYDTLNDLINADNIVDGSITRTLGLETYNDGKGSFYKIRTITSGDVVDGVNIIALDISDTLIAELIKDFDIESLKTDVGTLQSDVSDIQEELENIDFNYQELADNVQCLIAPKFDFSEIFDSDWADTSVEILNINNSYKGVIIANDWGSSSGNKFTIKTFDYDDENGTYSNVTTAQSLIDGHSNSMCKIDEEHLLIIAMSHNYVYDVVNNTLTEITNDIPYCRSCAYYSDRIYLASDYDHINNEEENSLYEIEFDEEYVPNILHRYELEGLHERLKMLNQGMVIYNNLIIFITYSAVRLLIYDLKTRKYLKTQLFTAPYSPEFEDGFIFDNKLLLIDSFGRCFYPDIYGQESIGSYYDNCITKSLTDICLWDDIVKLNDSNKEYSFKLNKYFGFNHQNTNTTQIGVVDGLFDSITIYGNLRNYSGSNGTHVIKPITIPCYKQITYQGDTLSFQENNWEASYTTFNSSLGTMIRCTIAGGYYWEGGDSVPTLKLKIWSTYLVEETYDTSNNTLAIDHNNTYDLYITKIIGHRKVSTGI